MFLNQPIRNKSRLWRPCLLTDRDEMSNLYRGRSIDASYQVSVHLVEGVLEAYLFVIQFIVSIFKLKLSPFPHKQIFFQKASYHKHELPVATMFVNGSGCN